MILPWNSCRSLLLILALVIIELGAWAKEPGREPGHCAELGVVAVCPASERA